MRAWAAVGVHLRSASWYCLSTQAQGGGTGRQGAPAPGLARRFQVGGTWHRVYSCCLLELPSYLTPFGADLLGYF